MRKKFFLGVCAAAAAVSCGFFGGQPSWREGVRRVGIEVQTPAAQPTVRFEKSRVKRFQEAATQKDENIQARLLLALKDFSFSQEIFKEFDFAFKQHTAWTAVAPEEFGKTKPDLVLKIAVLDYGLLPGWGKNTAKVFFRWEVEGIRQPEEKKVFSVKRKKVSSSRDLKKWMLNQAEMFQGELRAHIIFATQDLMRKTKMRTKISK